ncbi:MAG TPA: amino acid adenylation domain-containing protein [Lysobacter sp.]|nr:amino acid adenylation domain-containing protein [Lysobacter sp.]
MSTRYGAAQVAAIDYDPFASGQVVRVVPTTEPQREIWLADQLGTDASLAFNESVSLRLRGALDADALQEALRGLLDRHSALRTNLGPDGETQCVLDRVELTLDCIDLTGLSADQRNATVAERLRLAVETPFDLRHDRLFRAELMRLAPDEHLLVLTAHHIVCDGWSWWVLVQDLGALYASQRDRDAPPLPPVESFSDYALAEAGDAARTASADDEAYWLSRFADSVPVLELPTDRPRPSRRSFASRREDHVIDAELVAAVRHAGASRGVSMFATLLAALASLMSRLTGQSQVVVGIPAAGQAVDGHERLVGHCVNLLPLRFDLDPAQSFEQVLAEAQDTLLDAIEHQRYTFGTLLKTLKVERDPARLPLVSLMFNIDQALERETTGFPGLSMTFDSNPRSFENFEIFINAVHDHGTLRLECQYNTDLFDAATIRRWLAAYESLLRAAVANPAALAASLPLVDAEAYAKLEALQPEPVPYDRQRRMHEAFEAQCDRSPERVALEFAGRILTYAQLEERANRIAHLLRARGVKRGGLVGIALDRGTDMVAGVLGILKAGAGYVPLDPQFPAERLAYMAGDAGLAALLTQHAHAAKFDLRGRAVLMLDRLEDELAAMPTLRLGRDADAAGPESVAYVIYTSGSTGRPKGVQVPHRAVANFLVGMLETPGIQTEDRLLAVTTLSFDIAVLELMLPLCVGARVVLADRDTAMDGAALNRMLVSSGATLMQATPATWRLLLEAGWAGAPGFAILCGGEPLPADLASALLPRCGALWNLYGPTETTVWSTVARVRQAPGRPVPDIHIGRPIANTRIWILDERGGVCPRGVPGEICIGGDGVTLGYLDRPELTAERFVPDGFAGGSAATAAPLLYRTGDLGRWRPDGNLEHLGRLDFQVKVRGYRIELGEIESNLAGHLDVARAVVVAREDRPGDVRLVAYVVPRNGCNPESAALAAHLRRTLPDYMVPQHFVMLDAIPLMPNGKVDRKALPAPDAGNAGDAPRTEDASPRDGLEQSIADAMAKVLGRSRVGIHEGFFEMGGHSLLAAQLCARLSRELDMEIPLRSLFDASTVAALAELLRSRESAQPGKGAMEIPRRGNQTTAPMTLMQQRLWVLDQMEPGSVTWNTPAAHRLTGALDRVALEAALQEMVRRQASLRTGFVASDDGDEVMQQVLETINVPLLPFEDLCPLPMEEREPALRTRLDALIATPFELDRAPLFRAGLFRLAEQEHVLFFMVHHIIWDGWSFDLFYDEMTALYTAFSTGRHSPLPELEVSYGDFADWHRQRLAGEEVGRQLDYWKRQLEGAQEPLDLPVDFARPPQMSGRGSTEWLSFDRDTADGLRALGAQAGGTLFMSLLAAYCVLLSRLTGQRELTIGVPVRNRDSAALEGVMGLFVNMLPLRFSVDPERPFSELVRHVRERVLEAFSYPDVPFEQLVRELHLPRDPSRSPVYQAMFSFQDVRQRPGKWGELKHERFPVFQPGVAQDLGLWFVETRDGLSGGLAYNTDIFADDTAVRFHRRFAALLSSLQARPEVAVGDLDLFSPEDRASLDAWNRTQAEPSGVSTLHELLQAQARRTPERVAVRFGEATLSYAGLDARSNRIAQVLRGRGVRAGDLVGICLDRGLDLVAAMVGVLKAGAGYVPLDPGYPPARLHFIAEDAGLALIVTEEEPGRSLGWPRDRLLLLDEEADRIAAAPAQSPAVEGVGPESVAYVIYTSGSTGQPKGVCLPHRAVLNFLASMAREPGLDEHDRLLAVTTTSFDIAVLELFLPLAVGAQIVMASREQALDGHLLAELMAEAKPTVMQATPSTWRMLFEAGWQGDARLRVLVGGEPLAPELAARLCAGCAAVWNLYGPTETTVWSTCCQVIRPQDGISIGRPIMNTSVHVRDERGGLCPVGVPGEIWIGGAGVALGYHRRPELDAERFIDDPYSSQPDARLYRTGDRGRWRADGTLEHLGRLDFQVKIRGHRIELGEIEARAAADPAVVEAIAVVREDRPDDLRLVLYLTARAGTEIDPLGMRARLKTVLPDYMVPQHLVVLDAMPLLPNGKLDRKALPAPVAPVVAPVMVVDEAPDARVAYLIQVWSDLLGIEVGSEDNFFDLGGHSMLAVQMANRVARDTGTRIRLISLATQALSQVAADLPDPEAPTEPIARRSLVHNVMRMFGLAGEAGKP